MGLSHPAADASWLALATTAHVALAALGHHRGNRVRVLPSLACLALPWLMPSVLGLCVGLLVHAAWFALGERLGLAPARPQPQPARAVPPPPRPSALRAPAPRGFVQAPVLHVLDESPDIRTFRLARPEGFDFKPGQFLTVRLRSDGRELVRCYSISSAPSATGYLEISVKRQGLVSHALHAGLRPGSLLAVRAPAGGFTYPGDDDRPLALFAGGIGITPLLAMLRHAVLADPGRPMTLVYSARRESDLAFRDELSAIARRHPQVRICLAASRAATSPDVYPGRIDRALIESAVPEVAHSVALLCGPQAMIDGVSEILRTLGVDAAAIRSELFEAAVASSSRPREAGAEAAEAPADGPAYQLRATRCQRTVSVAAGQTLLEAADAHGLDIPSICRAGVCGTCRTRVVEGDVECSSTLLDDHDRAQGIVLACVASPRSDCVIEA